MKDRNYPSPKNLAERIYFDQLKMADRQAILSTSLFEAYSNLLENLRANFHEVSSHPSQRSVSRLRRTAVRLRDICERISLWCEQRAATWDDFLDACSLYMSRKKEEKSLLRRQGLKAIRETLIAGIIYVSARGQIPLTIVLRIVAQAGIEGMKMLLSLRWQTKSLMKSAKSYRRLIGRIEGFLALYEKEFDEGFFRY